MALREKYAENISNINRRSAKTQRLRPVIFLIMAVSGANARYEMSKENIRGTFMPQRLRMTSS